MAGTQIRGKQIKDDSITGDDVNEDTLVLKYFTTHKYTAEGTSNELYVRFNAGGSNYLGDAMVNNKFIAPADGKLKFIAIRSTNNMGTTNISIMRITNSEAAFGTRDEGSDPPTYTERAGASLETKQATVANANETYIAEFSTNSFSAGHVLGIKINPSNNHGNVDITAVWEFDWSS